MFYMPGLLLFQTVSLSMTVVAALLSHTSWPDNSLAHGLRRGCASCGELAGALRGWLLPHCRHATCAYTCVSQYMPARTTTNGEDMVEDNTYLLLGIHAAIFCAFLYVYCCRWTDALLSYYYLNMIPSFCSGCI